MIGDGRETYSDSTLKAINKSKLIEIIRCLEGNLKSANETIDIQTMQCEKLLDSTQKAYYQRGRVDATNKFVANAITEFQKFDKEHGYPTLADISVICVM